MVLAYGHRGICIRSSTLGIISQLLVHIDFPKILQTNSNIG